ncbi:MAG: hypothetical protein HRT80_05215 [Henriciella sp.]|nr:hypothetical protein [Henriciella sp.]
MQDRLAGILACGFASLILIGAAGAVSDSYFEKLALEETELVSCSEDRMDHEDASEAMLDCSVHRVSATYSRQTMAFDLKRDRAFDD